MTKLPIAILIAMTLAACEPSEHEKSRAKSQLPAGCQIIDLGAYGEARALYIVQCQGRTTQTLNYTYTVGKNSRAQITTATIDQ